MKCGKKYEALLVTAGSGYTPENPYGLFALPYDFSEWRELAFRMGVKAGKHLSRLQSAEKTVEQTQRANELVDEYNVVVEAVDALPGLLGASLTGVQLEQAIAQAVAAAGDAACVMEEIDAELSALGVNPPGEHEGRKPKTKPLDMSGVLNLALLAGVAYVGYRVVKGTGGL